jgi:hypothetical protein
MVFGKDARRFARQKGEGMMCNMECGAKAPQLEEMLTKEENAILGASMLTLTSQKERGFINKPAFNLLELVKTLAAKNLELRRMLLTNVQSFDARNFFEDEACSNDRPDFNR